MYFLTHSFPLFFVRFSSSIFHVDKNEAFQFVFNWNSFSSLRLHTILILKFIFFQSHSTSFKVPRMQFLQIHPSISGRVGLKHSSSHTHVLNLYEETTWKCLFLLQFSMHFLLVLPSSMEFHKSRNLPSNLFHFFLLLCICLYHVTHKDFFFLTSFLLLPSRYVKKVKTVIYYSIFYITYIDICMYCACTRLSLFIHKIVKE